MGFRSRRYRRRLQDSVAGRRILVTGASSGIGREFALQAGEAGARMTLVARRTEELEAVVDEIRSRGGHAAFHPLDLASPETVSEVAERIGWDGPVDVIVHNAAISMRRPVVDTKVSDLERLVAVDYLGAAASTLGLLPTMRARGRGHIVQISTIGVLTGAPNFAGYVAAKAAADHFARTLRLELGGEGFASRSSPCRWSARP